MHSCSVLKQHPQFEQDVSHGESHAGFLFYLPEPTVIRTHLCERLVLT